MLRHIVADTNVSPFSRAHNICCGHKFCVRDTKNVSDFVHKHFESGTNVFQFAQPKKHHVSETMCPRLPGPQRRNLGFGYKSTCIDPPRVILQF